MAEASHYRHCEKRPRPAAGHTFIANIIVIANHLCADDFWLGCNILVDLTALRVSFRDAKPGKVLKVVHEESGQQEVPLVVSAEDIVSGPFECKLMLAKLSTQQQPSSTSST